MKVHFITHGCKANQYDTERFRQELEARGATVTDDPSQADAFVINTCTVTDNADGQARKAIRRASRDNPDAKVVVAGCSAALNGHAYGLMDEVFGVVPGHDAAVVAGLLAPSAPLVDSHEEPIGATLLQRNRRGTRAWMKIQDGCDRRCSFCATKIARGASRSRTMDELVAEARGLAQHHPEIVLTGVHIGHYGIDLPQPSALSQLCATLVDEVPGARFRLGSIEATEIDDLLVHLLEDSDGRLVPHLHVPMQSGADSVLRRMRRWHTRDDYRSRVEEIAGRLPVFGLGADVIVGFPGETDAEFADTRALVSSLPFTYLHVFPYSVRAGTGAAELPNRVPKSVKADRSRELREIAVDKAQAYQQRRVGQAAEIVVEEAGQGITEDYLRVRLDGPRAADVGAVACAPLGVEGDELVALV